MGALPARPTGHRPVAGERPLPGTRLLAKPWFRWSVLIASALAALVDLVVTVARRSPADVPWILCIGSATALGVVVVLRRPRHPLTGYVVLVGLASVGQLAESAMSHLLDGTVTAQLLAWLNLTAQMTSLAATVAMAHVLGLFADGVVRRGYQRTVLSALWLTLLVPPVVLVASPNLALPYYLDAPAVDNPLHVTALGLDAGVSDVLVSQMYSPVLAAGLLLAILRYRGASPAQRQPMRWLLLPLVVATAAMATQALIGDGEPRALVSLLVMAAAVSFSVAIGMGLLQPAGISVDRVLRNAFVYAVLWVLIAALYVAVGAAVGLAAGQRLSLGWAVTIAVLAAVAFAPLRARLERATDRWVFGRVADPAQIVQRLGSALAGTYELDTLLPRIESTLAQGLGLQWVRVRLGGDTQPEGETPSLSTPIVLDGERIGTIDCGPKTVGRISEADAALVRTFAQQAALAVRNVRLTADLNDKAEQLNASRARLVRAQEAERRRIERNIHDGVQQDLVAMMAIAGHARNDQDPDAASDALAAIGDGLQQVLDDVRELAQGIHPSVLSDQGLLRAVEALSARVPLDVTVHADDGLRGLRLPDEVEAAAYFTVAESLTNSVKHASARHADVVLAGKDGTLSIRVTDDGVGFDSTDGGHGIDGLAERLSALGGTIAVSGDPGHGTTVYATLHLPEGEMRSG